MGVRINFNPMFSFNWFPLRVLISLLHQTMFSQDRFAPFLEIGTMWSTVPSGAYSPDYWQIFLSRLAMFLVFSFGILFGIPAYFDAQTTNGIRIMP